MARAAAALWLSMAACHRHELGSEPHTVEREYARPAAGIWAAAVESAKEGLRSASYDREGGTIEGDGVRITVAPVHEKRCRVSIRVGPDELARARSLHGRIGELAGGAP
jgi:hypothetical protein